MARFFVYHARQITTHECDAGAPLRIGAHGAPVSDDTWIASLVTFAPNGRAPERHALVARPGAPVSLGADRLVAGVAEVTHGAHVFVAGIEAILDTDAVPIAIDDLARDESCPVCCTRRGSEGRTALLACPRCGAGACDVCWSAAPGSRCLTAGCEQPAASDRPLSAPGRADFCTWLGDDGDAAGAETP